MNKGLTFQAPRRAQGEPDKKMFELSKSNCSNGEAQGRSFSISV